VAPATEGDSFQIVEMTRDLRQTAGSQSAVVADIE